MLVAGRWMGQPGFASLHKHADHWDPQRALVISDALLQTDRTLPRRLPMWRATATGRARRGATGHSRSRVRTAPRGGCCACGRPPVGHSCCADFGNLERVPWGCSSLPLGLLAIMGHSARSGECEASRIVAVDDERRGQLQLEPRAELRRQTLTQCLW